MWITIESIISHGWMLGSKNIDQATFIFQVLKDRPTGDFSVCSFAVPI